MNSLKVSSLFLLGLVLAIISATASSETEEAGSDASEKTEEISKEQVEYAKGSVCGYCEYCKFCKLCDADCPCETSASKPNCKMCKYCKYCYLCSAVCDTICTPGGILDRVSASIVNSLPTVNRAEVDSDIESVKSYIDRKDEL